MDYGHELRFRIVDSSARAYSRRLMWNEPVREAFVAAGQEAMKTVPADGTPIDFITPGLNAAAQACAVRGLSVMRGATDAELAKWGATQ